MPRSIYLPVSGLFALTVLAAVGMFTITAAEPPSASPPSASPASEPPAKIAMRRVLEGDASVIGKTGDPMLDDALSILDERGSILDGSVLDPRVLDFDSDPVETDRRGSCSDRARAAEQLLKASRLLEKLRSSDEARADLIARIRVEAAKLLSE